MTTWDFLHPEHAVWLLALVALVLVAALLRRRSARQFDRVLGGRRAALVIGPSQSWPWILILMTLSGVAGLVASMDPIWGEEKRSLPSRGSDIVICLDVSRSMRARDVVPDRLGAAKIELGRLIDQMVGDRLGLVVYAGEARCVAPLSSDLSSVLEMIEAVDELSVSKGGSDLGAAIDVALDLIPEDGARAASILLIGDGEDHGGRALSSASKAQQRGVPISILAMGTPLGAKIPVMLGDEEIDLKDANGRAVLTALVPESLEAVARQSQGRYIEVAHHPAAAQFLYEDFLRGRAMGGASFDERYGAARRFRWPLGLALLAALLAFALGRAGANRS